MYKQILCPVDRRETSNCVVREAIDLAKTMDAQLRFLHVIDLYLPIMNAAGDINVVYKDDFFAQTWL